MKVIYIFTMLMACALWAVPAVGQTAISGDGVVESTLGGFKFPDGTVQSSAAGSEGTPVEATGTCLVANDQNSAVGLIFTVPADKRLEIEFVSFAAANLAAGEGLLPAILANSTHIFEEMVGGNHYPGFGASLVRAFSTVVHIHAAAGSSVGCEVWTTLDIGTNRQLKATIAGHLIDVIP